MDPGADRQCGASCICKLCECGIHKCPAKHTSAAVHYPSDLGSEYRQTFVAWPRQKRASPPCRADGRSARDGLLLQKPAKFTGITTSMVDYAPKKIPPRAPPAASSNSSNNCIGDGGHHALDGRTTYNGSFWDKSKQLPKRIAPTHHGSVNAIPGAPFYGETTHHADFGPKPMPKRVLSAGNASHSSSNSGSFGAAGDGLRFDADTTYHETYKKWPLAPRRADAKHGPGPLPPAKFDGESMYHTDFQAPKLPKRCPVLLRRPPSLVDGDHMVYDHK